MRRCLPGLLCFCAATYSCLPAFYQYHASRVIQSWSFRPEATSSSVLTSCIPQPTNTTQRLHAQPKLHSSIRALRGLDSPVPQAEKRRDARCISAQGPARAGKSLRAIEPYNPGERERLYLSPWGDCVAGPGAIITFCDVIVYLVFNADYNRGLEIRE